MIVIKMWIMGMCLTSMDFGKIKIHKILFNPLLPTNAGKDITMSTFSNHIAQILPVIHREKNYSNLRF